MDSPWKGHRIYMMNESGKWLSVTYKAPSLLNAMGGTFIITCQQPCICIVWSLLFSILLTTASKTMRNSEHWTRWRARWVIDEEVGISSWNLVLQIRLLSYNIYMNASQGECVFHIHYCTPREYSGFITIISSHGSQMYPLTLIHALSWWCNAIISV